MRTFTLDVISDRAVTSSSLLFNEEWVQTFLNVEESHLTQCMNSFTLAMGGGYEIVYQHLSTGRSVDIPALVWIIVKSFVSCCDVEIATDSELTANPVLSAKVLEESNSFQRKWILS